MANQRDLKKKIQTQNIIIIALAITIFVLMAVSGTAAWYIRTKSDTADIILSNPVNIYITEFDDLKDDAGNLILGTDGQPIRKHELREDILEQYNTQVYPGDKIKLRLGMQVGTAEVKSSPAYVRVKLVITYENIFDGVSTGLQEVKEDGLIDYKDKPDVANWEQVNFNKFKQAQQLENNPTLEGETPIPDDIWFVLRDYNPDGSIRSRIADELEFIEFLDGYIELNKFNITNKHANCKFHINYVVEAIQTANVPDPLVDEGKGPWWDFILGDIDDEE